MDNGKKKMKKKSKLAVDILMTLTLLFLMGYQLWGETAHEWAGAFMLVLFLAHHVLNTAWHRNLFRGKYTRVRILTSAVDLALFALMAFHLGLHWGMTLARFRQMLGMDRSSGIRRTVLRIAGGLTAGYGLYVFVTRDLATYMFLRTQFVFLDYSESPISFYIDYLAMMGLFIWIAHYLSVILLRPGRKIPSAKKKTVSGRLEAQNKQK